MSEDSLQQVVRPAVMQEEYALAQAPQRCGAEFVTRPCNHTTEPAATVRPSLVSAPMPVSVPAITRVAWTYTPPDGPTRTFNRYSLAPWRRPTR